MDLPRLCSGKESCLCRRHQRCGLIPGSGDPVEEDTVTHCSILAWEAPWTEGPGGIQSMGSQRVTHSWATACMHVLKNKTILTHTNPFLLRYWVLRTFWIVYCDEFIQFFFLFFGRGRSVVPIFLCLRANRKTVYLLREIKIHCRNGQNYAKNAWNILPFHCFSFHIYIYIYIYLGSLSFSLDVSISFQCMTKFTTN